MASILETARDAGCFGTLLTAVDVAGLTGALAGPGPFTVFAPVDDAFAALPPGCVQTLVDNPPQLARILRFHVLSGALKRSALVDQAEWESLEGAPVAIRRSDPFEVKNATVVTADIVCDNGIVHVIDRVILPGEQRGQLRTGWHSLPHLRQCVDFVHVRMIRRRYRLLTAALLGAVALAGCAPEGGGGVVSATLARINGRDKLICGVEGKLPGFSIVGPDGAYSGLDVDVCKAVAAALLDDPDKVEYRDLNSSERFAALASGEVDMLSRNTTLTLSRDSPGGNGLSFGPTTFYDGQGMMAPVASGIKSLKDLAGKPICVESGTTTELNLADRMREQDITYTPLKFQTSDQTYAAYLGNRCVAVTSDRSQLAAKRTSFPEPDAHALLPDVLSKEPLTPATSNGDPAWADAVRWIVYGLMQAEESGITQANIDAKLAEAQANTNLADLRRFLGVEGDFGKQLGLPADFVVKSLRAVGNYGEIFDRNVGPGSRLKLERGLNRQWTDGGLIYSPPFR